MTDSTFFCFFFSALHKRLSLEICGFQWISHTPVSLVQPTKTLGYPSAEEAQCVNRERLSFSFLYIIKGQGGRGHPPNMERPTAQMPKAKVSLASAILDGGTMGVHDGLHAYWSKLRANPSWRAHPTLVGGDSTVNMASGVGTDSERSAPARATSQRMARELRLKWGFVCAVYCVRGLFNAFLCISIFRTVASVTV